ncbi:MAG: hypothetical protein U0K57_00990 [Lachnospiraceae bacterium]|nr:hypothetical protein [Lachnospiraceae bacterium]
MNWLSKLERKFGKYAIRNLPLYIVILYVIGAVLDIMGRTRGVNIYASFLSLNPYMVLHGQVFRLLTFLMAAPTTSLIFLIFVLLFYYSIAQSLVNVWGAFRFNMYMLVGVLGTIAGAFIMYAITKNPYIYMDTYYLNLSMFLAYAAIFPDMRVYLYGIIPIRVRYLAYLDVALLVWLFIQGDMGSRISIVVSLLNFILFFVSTRNYGRISPKERKRRRDFKAQVKQGYQDRPNNERYQSAPKKDSGPVKIRTSNRNYRHKCTICGKTELDDPNLEFRFCSKCKGDHEYCNDHLFNHEHIK